MKTTGQKLQDIIKKGGFEAKVAASILASDTNKISFLTMKNTKKVSCVPSRTTDKQLVKMSHVCYGYIKGGIFFQERKMTGSVRHSITHFLVSNFVTPAAELF